MQEFKQELIGQREGLIYALDLLEEERKTLIGMIKTVDIKIKEIK